MNLESVCKQTCELAVEVGKFIRQEASHFKRSSIEYKGKNDMVSYVDKETEKKLVSGLQKIIPDSGFITEEKTINTEKRTYTWIIDPLDGTTNFIHGIPCYCISIGLMLSDYAKASSDRQDKLVMGVIYEINLDECFYAWEGSKAFLNGKDIRVSEVNELKDALLATGFPYYDYSQMKPYMEVFDYCIRNTHGVRRWGSAAADLAYVACGRFEGFYEYGLQPWDVAAGVFILQQAGGKISDFSGGTNFVFGKELIACNAGVHAEFLKVMKERFKASA